MNKKLLFVDDEPAAIKGYKMLLDYSGFGIDIIGEASNGEDALEIIKCESPDIVITDIWMPVMDGIELMKAIHEKKLNIKVIVLSGYDEFEYAKLAVTYGAFDYLVKPVESEQLTIVLQKAIENINEDLSLRYAAEKANAHEADSMLRERFFKDFFADVLNFASAKNKAKFWDIEFYETVFCVMAICVDSFAHNLDFSAATDRQLLTYAVSNIAGDIVSAHKLGTSVLIDGIVFIVLNPEDGGLKYDTINLIASELACNTLRYMNEPLSIGIGDIYPYKEGVRASYDNALKALNTFIKEDNRRTIRYSDMVLTNETTPVYPKKEADHLLILIEGGQQYLQICENLTNSFISANAGNLQGIHNFCNRLSVDLALLSRSYGGDVDKLWSKLGKLVVPVEVIRTRFDLSKWIFEIAGIYARAIADKRKSKENDFIELVIAYIESNYEKELTLTKLAERVYMSPAYLSTVFKSKTGKSITEQILNVRMEKAALLLKNTDFKVYAVAEMTGFNNIRYFNDVFKKFYGIPPGKYKEKMSGK